MRLLIFIALGALLTLQSCQSDCTSLRKQKIDEAGWNYSDTISFMIDAQDTTKYYDLVLKVKHTEEFSFQNLYVRSTTEFPSGERIQDPISLNLGNLAGQWNGKCSGKTCTAPILLQSKFRFLELGEHTITFEQFSRKERIKGVLGMELLLCADPG
jgi:gliding motility-associated lipoprotein GldH